MKKRFTRALGAVLAVLGLVLTMTIYTTTDASSAPILTLQAENGQLSGPAYASGAKVHNIGKNGGNNEGKITFKSLDLPSSGYYTLKVTYASGSDDRYFNITTDDDTYKLPCPNSGGFDKTATVQMDVQLKKGGKLIVGSEWYGPDLDKIEIFAPQSQAFPNRTYENRAEEVVQSGDITLRLDLNNGIYSLDAGEKRAVADAHAEAVVNGAVIASHDFETHQMAVADDGKTVTFVHRGHADFAGTMTQTFVLRDSYLLTEVTLRSEDAISTNRITPLSVYEGGLPIDNGVFVQIPYDNDMWIEPQIIGIRKLGTAAYSYEVGAFYDAASGAGVVAGSVEHDTWKTGVEINAQQASVMGFSVYGGIADSITRDVEEHGYLTGTSVKSPRIFVGYYADWRDGLDRYAKANTAVVPPKPSVPDVPFGYNSWGVLQSKVSYSDMIAVSDYIRENLQDVWQQDGAPVYVNIDSFWDFITHNDPGCGLTLEEALKAFVEHCHQNGQKAGIYFTPFTAWHSNEEALKNSRITGTGYTYYDAAIKRTDGSGLYGKLDGGFALDPTHPATIKRFTDQLNTFIEYGFEYVKLDFMAHGAVEGVHYEKDITTGIAAYNYGMAKIREICAGKLVVNLSIAPLFPYQYADGRRISCDAFASLDNTRHVLSYLTACFWEENIYPYPDPDHLVVWGEDGAVSDGEARCRVTAGAISGTSFLVGDNLADIVKDSPKDVRIRSMFGNADIVSVAKLGRAFTPWSVMPGERCADAYWCEDDGGFYLAVFNFDGDERDVCFSLADRIGEGEVLVRELWRGTDLSLTNGALIDTIPAKDAAVYRITSADTEEAETTEEMEMVITNSDNKVVKEKNPVLPYLLGGAAVLIAAAAAVVVNKNKKK